MIKVLRTMATGVAVGLLTAVTPTTAHAQTTDYVEHVRALDTGLPAETSTDTNVLTDVKGLVGAPVSV
ncbi:hypothetical protein ACVB8X_10185 [Streptomyces sp. NRAIS4]